jgi:hypothetical protein
VIYVFEFVNNILYIKTPIVAMGNIPNAKLGEGSGLGYSTCKHILFLMGGYITLFTKLPLPQTSLHPLNYTKVSDH